MAGCASTVATPFPTTGRSHGEVLARSRGERPEPFDLALAVLEVEDPPPPFRVPPDERDPDPLVAPRASSSTLMSATRAGRRSRPPHGCPRAGDRASTARSGS